MLATYFILQFLHSSVLLDFGAPNPGRPHRSCSWRLGGRHNGGLPHAIGERRLRPWRRGMAEDRLRRPNRFIGGRAAGMAGCWPAAWRHCLEIIWAGRSWRQRAPEFWARWCGRKLRMVRRWRWSLLLRPCAFTPVFWCALWGPACWQGSWVSFRPTQHNLSSCHSLQNWLPTWHHCQGRRVD